MALALRDEGLIRKCFESRGGWKFHFDDYLADGRFYGEEFGKEHSMVGETLLWCRGVERLGLDGLGFGYVGKGGRRCGGTSRASWRSATPAWRSPAGSPTTPRSPWAAPADLDSVGRPPTSSRSRS